MIFICAIIKIRKNEKFDYKKLLNKDLIISGLFQSLSCFCVMQMSIKVDYLFNVLLRSSKFLTVLLGTVIFKTHSHHVSKRDIYWGVVMTLGVVVFSFG